MCGNVDYPGGVWWDGDGSRVNVIALSPGSPCM